MAFVGYTPQYAASVMVLNPKRNQDVGGYGGRGAPPDLARRHAADPVRAGARRLPPAGLPLTNTAAARPRRVPAARPADRPPPQSRPGTDHQLGGPLAEHHRGGRGPARRRPRQHRRVDDAQPRRRPRTRSCWSTTAPGIAVGPHPGRARQVHRGGQPGPDPAVERARRRPARRRAGRVRAAPSAPNARVRSSVGGQPDALPQPPPVRRLVRGSGTAAAGAPPGRRRGG